jgi:hypothetical protein
VSHGQVSRLLLENLPDQPQVTERVDDGALQHPLDRVGSKRRVRVLLDWAVFDRASGQRLPVYGDWVIHEELDPSR